MDNPDQFRSHLWQQMLSLLLDILIGRDSLLVLFAIRGAHHIKVLVGDLDLPEDVLDQTNLKQTFFVELGCTVEQD